MAICTVCNANWCGCGGGVVCGACLSNGAVRRPDSPTWLDTPDPTPTGPPRTYQTMPGQS